MPRFLGSSGGASPLFAFSGAVRLFCRGSPVVLWMLLPPLGVAGDASLTVVADAGRFLGSAGVVSITVEAEAGRFLGSAGVVTPMVVTEAGRFLGSAGDGAVL